MNKLWNRFLKLAVILMLISAVGIYYVDQHLPPALEQDRMLYVILLAVIFGSGLIFLIAYRIRISRDNKFTVRSLAYTILVVVILFLLMWNF
ncbi:hypothetical protein ACFFJY_02565 [Fictibacillus aquaticus]|uniref:Histidine kinase n=1 Tax=Fictibacillus aquaticus TaxID=2021314 RepID=A0A235F8F0_9BACL|nr:hypothetical protein [Fictibacillus aquaticus]OYD57586.1 hypothetical protein CGZ90_13035 [Fictibacillus aquaticus]